MTKNVLNQKAKYVQDLIDTIEPDFIFNNRPVNRLNVIKDVNDNNNQDKLEKLSKLKNQINSIQNCNLRDNSKKLIFGDGDIDSPIMLIGENPNEKDENLGLSFQGEIGELLTKMLLAINIKRDKIYLTNVVNYRPPNNRKPEPAEITRYSNFLREHISIINPKILILMGSTAMESLFSSKIKISKERGKWKEIIINNKTYLVIITFHPAYLLRQADQKKYSWADLKKIRKKIDELNIEV